MDSVEKVLCVIEFLFSFFFLFLFLEDCVIQRADTEDQRAPVLTQVHWPEYCKIFLNIGSLFVNMRTCLCSFFKMYVNYVSVYPVLLLSNCDKRACSVLSHSLKFLASPMASKRVSRKTVTVCKPQLQSSFKG